MLESRNGGTALHDYGTDEVRICGLCHMLQDLIATNPDAARRIIEELDVFKQLGE